MQRRARGDWRINKLGCVGVCLSPRQPDFDDVIIHPTLVQRQKMCVSVLCAVLSAYDQNMFCSAADSDVFIGEVGQICVFNRHGHAKANKLG